jgi:hypothetical protein
VGLFKLEVSQVMKVLVYIEVERRGKNGYAGWEWPTRSQDMNGVHGQDKPVGTVGTGKGRKMKNIRSLVEKAFLSL